jgi:5'(3')-deoxyribonucleotidase
MKPLFFCDLDGVLAAFHEAAMARCLRLDLDKYKKFLNKNGGWYEHDWPEGDTRMIHEYLDISKDDFWRAISRDQYFWVHLPKYEWATSLVNILTSYGEVRFLSAPGPNASAFSGKKEWVDKHFPHIELMLVKSDSKQLLSGKGRILIDDLEENVASWEHHVLFPRRWNKNYNLARQCYEYTLLELGKILQREDFKSQT